MALGRRYILIEKYGTVENLEKAIAEYFRQCAKRKKPSTIERLAEFLDCSERAIHTMREYCIKCEDIVESENEIIEDDFFSWEKLQFAQSIKKALQRIKAEDIERLKERGNSGDIFVAKNHGYTDKQEIEHSGGLKLEDFLK